MQIIQTVSPNSFARSASFVKRNEYYRQCAETPFSKMTDEAMTLWVLALHKNRLSMFFSDTQLLNEIYSKLLRSDLKDMIHDIGFNAILKVSESAIAEAKFSDIKKLIFPQVIRISASPDVAGLLKELLNKYALQRFGPILIRTCRLRLQISCYWDTIKNNQSSYIAIVNMRCIWSMLQYGVVCPH